MANTSTIANPKNTRKVFHKDGNTEDIIKTIIWADKYAAIDTKKFAPQIKGRSTEDTCRNVWQWVKKNVHYVLDPPGEQYIKSPSKTFKDGYADCKSRSVFMASLLKNLGIPYAYRFASYSGGYPYTHVYVVAKPFKGIDYIMDPDMGQFNIQKQSNYTKDYNMSRIEYLAGVEDSQVGRLKLHLPADQMTELDMELAIRKQREEINKGIIESVSGIGCPHAETVQDRIDAYKDAIEIRSNSSLTADEKLAGIGQIAEDFQEGRYAASRQIAGIGNLSERQRQRVQQLHELHRRRYSNIEGIGKKGGFKKFTKKLGSSIKKLGKGLLRVATLPQRTLVKGILEVTLPKIAPLFIYLFIKDKKIIASLPKKAKKKRKVSERLAKFIVKVIGMKEDHFMGIVRNGIMKRYKQSPESVLSKSLHQNINGIGDIGYIQFVMMAISLIGKLIKVFKKKTEGDEGDLASDLKNTGEPDLVNDFKDVSASEKKNMASSIKKQKNTSKSQAEKDSDTIPGNNNRTSRIC